MMNEETKPKKKEVIWNRCDACGRFIAIKDFRKGGARRTLIQEAAYGYCESYETLCKKHA